MTLFKGISHSYNQKFRLVIGAKDNSGSAVTDCYPFNIPSDANFISFYVVGAGAGGFKGTTTTGGGGGGSGGVTSGIFSAKMLPSVVYLIVGAYGTGAIVGGATSSAGQASSVSLIPANNGVNANTALIIGNGGTNSTSTTGGAGGAATTSTTARIGGFSMGALGAYAGNTGGTQSGANISWPFSTSALSITGGAGGGSPSNNGSSVISASGSPIWSSSTFSLGGSTSSTSSNAGNGGNGYTNLCEANGQNLITTLILSAGGAGGGGNSSTGNGGNGGNGAPGSGGGGGGASTSGTPGNGGNGGPGFIIVQWW